MPHVTSPAEALPVSLAQLRFLEQPLQHRAYANVSSLAELAPELPLDAVEAAVRHAVWRHEALRSRFELAPGDPRRTRVSITDGHQSLRVNELEARDDPARPLDELLTETALRVDCAMRFDEEALFRASTFRLRGKRYLLLSMNHLLIDLQAIGLLTRDIQRRLVAPDAELPLRPSKIRTYMAYAEQRRARLETSYWTAPELQPPLCSWSADDNPASAMKSVAVDVGGFNEQLFDRYRVGGQYLAMAAVARACKQLFRRRWIWADVITRSRDLVPGLDLEDELMWCALNTPMRLFAGDALQDCVGANRRSVKAARANLIDYQVGRYLERSPALVALRPDIQLNYRGRIQESLSGTGNGPLPRFLWNRLHFHPQNNLFRPLDISLWLEGPNLCGAITYNQAVWKERGPALAAAIAGQLHSMVKQDD